jgi:rhodanese-related sulfurtransferase
MQTREKLTITLLILGLILALLPLRSTRSFTVSQEKLITAVLDNKTYLTVDQVARLIVNEDPSVQIVDLRSADEYTNFSIPGAINVPWNELTGKDPSVYLGSGKIKNVFYSNGDLNSNYAVVYAAGLGYGNCYAMKGGMNEWIRTVMNTKFSGEKISAGENALFEARTRAGKLFIEMNSLPDSLKIKYLNSKKFNPKKLDGGCE